MEKREGGKERERGEEREGGREKRLFDQEHLAHYSTACCMHVHDIVLLTLIFLLWADLILVICAWRVDLSSSASSS